MKIIDKSDWKQFKKSIDKKMIIHIQGSEKHELIRTITKKLHGSESSLPVDNSLDAMADVVSDWFYEKWGEKKNLYILGGEDIMRNNPKLLLNIYGVINDAFLSAIYTKSLIKQYDSIHNEINGFSLTFVL